MLPWTVDRPKLLLAASTGGHLAQLVRLEARFTPSDDSLWVTFDSEQSRSLLRGRRVLYVPYIAPRDMRSVVKASRIIWDAMSEGFDGAISTGAALALAALPIARLRGVSAQYIESVSRVDGPSLTGKLLALSHLVELRTQHAGWASRRWTPIDPVIAEFAAVPTAAELPAVPKIFVTLGTIRPYRFDRVIDSLLHSGINLSNTVWQLGSTTRSDLPGSVHENMTASEFDKASDEADVVITHAGVGTVMSLLERGRMPIVVPRRREYGEHVDNHQLEITSLTTRLGLAVTCEADQLTADMLALAAGHRVVAATATE